MLFFFRHIICFLVFLFSGIHAFSQEDLEPLIDTIPDSIPAKKLIEIPPFQLLNPDTIPLGEHDELICDSYTALGQPWVYDALHSFNSRRMDKFGGYLNVKINEGLAEIRKKGFNSDVKKLYIQIDPTTLTVFWSAVVGPSTDGRCYVSVDSRGSAGGGLPAVIKQCPRMHRIHTGLKPVKFLEYNENVIQCYDWNSNRLDSVCRYVNIQQHFYKYYDPRIGNLISVQDYASQESTIASANAPVPTNPVKKNTVSPASYRKYTVKSGDTLSQIAEKFHTSVSKIKKANGLRSDMIRAGQVLKIPK
jgi:LysM repeat protein